jgi:hypothetical protein
MSQVVSAVHRAPTLEQSRKGLGSNGLSSGQGGERCKRSHSLISGNRKGVRSIVLTQVKQLQRQQEPRQVGLRAVPPVGRLALPGKDRVRSGRVHRRAQAQPRRFPWEVPPEPNLRLPYQPATGSEQLVLNPDNPRRLP